MGAVQVQTKIIKFGALKEPVFGRWVNCFFHLPAQRSRYL